MLYFMRIIQFKLTILNMKIKKTKQNGRNLSKEKKKMTNISNCYFTIHYSTFTITKKMFSYDKTQNTVK